MNKNDFVEDLLEIPSPPPFPGANSRLILGGGGAALQPLQRLETFSDKQFEIFVVEWAHGFLKKEYNEVRKQGGAGDKGRDIVAIIDAPEIKPRRWNNYQCKHYKDPLAPTEIYSEFAKLCYYTFKGDYTVPENFFIVTHKGIGQKLSDLLDNPEQLKKDLISNWADYCEKKITSKQTIKLEGGLLKHVESFDFSIIKQIQPIELIEQHSKTKYHSLIFGTSLNKRPKPLLPPSEIDNREVRYVEQIYEAFSEHLRQPITQQQDFNDQKHLKNCFDKARVGFYCAESLKEFARDSLPDESFFTDLIDEFDEGLELTAKAVYPDGYERIMKTSEMALQLQLSATVLRDELKPNDRVGMCHQLANENRIIWVEK
jgi:hypothetical protein